MGKAKKKQRRTHCETCDHDLDDHTSGLDCRTCGQRCGFDCRPIMNHYGR